MDEDPAMGCSPPREFRHFSKLPAELRLKIWNLILPQPRVVSIRCGSDLLSSRRFPPPPAVSAPPSSPGCTSAAAVPAVLHVCTESRAEAARRYSLMFGVARRPGRVFFDPASDVLYFGPRTGYMASSAQLSTVLSLADPAELAHVRRVALSDALFWIDCGPSLAAASAAAADPPGYLSAVAATLTVDVLDAVRCRLPGVRELIVVPCDEGHPATGEVVLAAPPAAAHQRLAQQVQAAMACVREAAPEWVPPQWRIMVLRAADS